jgi:hypothetical protein
MPAICRRRHRRTGNDGPRRSQCNYQLANHDCAPRLRLLSVISNNDPDTTPQAAIP